MPGKKQLRKLRPRGRKARFSEYAGRTPTAIGQWAKGRLSSDYLDKKLREWDPDATEETNQPSPGRNEPVVPVEVAAAQHGLGQLAR